MKKKNSKNNNDHNKRITRVTMMKIELMTVIMTEIGKNDNDDADEK